jgi:hypothetical protein
MNEFERRWRIGAGAARRLPPEDPAQAPLGFATRTVAQWQSSPMPSVAQLWQWHAWRVFKVVLVLMMVALLMNAAVELGEWVSPSPLAAPAVEDTVAEALWML